MKSPLDTRDAAAALLRQRAERRLQNQGELTVPNRVQSERLLHELQVHQIELEMQNEDLGLAHDATRAALDQYTELYDFAPVGYLSLDQQGVIRRLNLVAAALLGAPRAELLGRRFADFTPGAALPSFAQGTEQGTPDWQGGSRELALHGADGVLRYARLQLPSSPSGPVWLLALMDMGQEHQAKLALADSEIRFRLLSDCASDWIFWLDPAGAYRYVSPACRDITGYGPEAFLADPELFIRRVHEEDRARVQAHFQDASGVDTAELEFRIVCSDGTERWICHHCQPILDPDGNYLGRRGSNRDCTERKQEEHRKALERERLTASLDLSRMVGVGNEQAVLAFALERAVHLLDSCYGFIGEISTDEQIMTVLAWSKEVMASCALDPAVFQFPADQLGLLVEPLHSRRPVVINHYDTHHAHKHGLPKGHVPIERFLAVPVFDGERVALIAAVANKTSQYRDVDADALSSLIDGPGLACHPA